MKRTWIDLLMRGVGSGVFYAPDAGGAAMGGEATPAEPMGAPSGGEGSDGSDADHMPVDAGDGAGAPEAEPSDDDLVFGDDEPSGSNRPIEEQLAALRARNRKLSRRYNSATKTLERFKGVDLDRLITQARNYESFEQMAQRNPRLRAMLLGQADEPEQGRQPAREQQDPEAFDDSPEALGFDPNDSLANRRLADALRQVHEFKQVIAQIAPMVPNLRGMLTETAQAKEQRERGEWISARESLLGEIDKHLGKDNPATDAIKALASDAVAAAFHARGQYKLSPKAVVDNYLAKLKKQGVISTQQAKTISAGAQSRMAQRNERLPQNPGGGAPASPNGNRRIRLADVHKRVRSGQIGG